MDDLKSPYLVQDQYEDPIPPNDAWGRWLSMRFCERPSFFRGLSKSEQELIRKEVQRIRYFREYFKSRKLSPSDRTPLIASMETLRHEWRKDAFARCGDELAIFERKILESGKSPVLERNCCILRRVQLWEDADYPHFQDSVSPESYIDNLAPQSNHADDNPDKSDYGYNGWVIAFDKGSRGVTLDHPLCHGHFPNQKISIQQLLYNNSETPLKRTNDKKQLRYFHLPANNMKWVEEAISRYYGEDRPEFDAHKALNIRSNTQRLLKHELWRGQQRGGVGSPVHSRHIGSRCSLVPSAPFNSQNSAGDMPALSRVLTGSSRSRLQSKDIALFMPYLHWEIEQRLVRMTDVVQRTTMLNEQQTKPKAHKGKFADAVNNWRIRLGRPAVIQKKKEGSWRPQSTLALYLWHVAKLFVLIDEAADERHIAENLHSSPPLHMRRTLDQFYYWTVEDTALQDRDQVVCRGTRSLNDLEATTRVVMVDQLWLWILDENTILSSFPRRWGRNKPDSSAVHRGIRDHMGKVDGAEINSIYDLALIIVDECSRVFFDRTKPLDQRPEVVDIFGSAISNIAEMKTMTYERFGRDVNTINAHDSLETVEELIRKSLNISFEWKVLIEAQHIIDELQIMQGIFTQQITVMRDFIKALEDMKTKARADSTLDDLESSLERAATLIADMDTRREELANLEKLQAKTRAQLRELLDMKQQQSGIIEAKAAIKRADEAVLQGRSIIVFTIVTIFFLPLSFFASVFGMNATELNGGGSPMHLNTQLNYMFGLSSIVIIIALAFAFSTWARTLFVLVFRLPYAYFSEWVGLHKIKSNYIYNVAALKKLENAKVEGLQRRHMERRVSEINARSPGSPLDNQDEKRIWKVSSAKSVHTGMMGLWNKRRRPDSEPA